MEDAHPPQIILRWSAFEHEHIERDSDWFWALGTIALSGAVISILFHDVLFGILILAAAITLGLLAARPPELANFEISERGIRIDGTLHRFHEIISFWVEDEHHRGRPFLLVNTTKFLTPNFVIPIEGVDPHHVRSLLKKHAKEAPMKEPIAHKILEFVGL